VLQKNRATAARVVASGRFIIIFNVLHRHQRRREGAGRPRGRGRRKGPEFRRKCPCN